MMTFSEEDTDTDFELVRVIKKSKFPVVLAHNAKTLRFFVAKYYPMEKDKANIHFLRESIALAKRLDHPNVIKYLGA